MSKDKETKCKGHGCSESYFHFRADYFLYVLIQNLVNEGVSKEKIRKSVEKIPEECWFVKYLNDISGLGEYVKNMETIRSAREGKEYFVKYLKM
jgi:hypothetical protein